MFVKKINQKQLQMFYLQNKQTRCFQTVYLFLAYF